MHEEVLIADTIIATLEQELPQEVVLHVQITEEIVITITALEPLDLPLLLIIIREPDLLIPDLLEVHQQLGLLHLQQEVVAQDHLQEVLEAVEVLQAEEHLEEDKIAPKLILEDYEI